MDEDLSEKFCCQLRRIACCYRFLEMCLRDSEPKKPHIGSGSDVRLTFASWEQRRIEPFSPIEWTPDEVSAIQRACHVFSRRGKHSYSIENKEHNWLWSSIASKASILDNLKHDISVLESWYDWLVRCLRDAFDALQKEESVHKLAISNWIYTLRNLKGTASPFGTSFRDHDSRLMLARQYRHSCCTWRRRSKHLLEQFNAWKAIRLKEFRKLKCIYESAGYTEMTMEVDHKNFKVMILDVQASDGSEPLEPVEIPSM